MTLVHPSLVLLAKLRFRAGCRKVKRALRTLKGIFLAIFVVGFFGFMLVPLVMARFHPPSADVREAMRPFGTWFVHPVALLAFFVLSVAASRFKSPLAFSMAEVEMLFPGPFTRRQLIVYKLAVSVAGTLGFALMIPLFVGWQFHLWWPAMLVGVWLTGTFEQWAAILVVLALDGAFVRFRALFYGLMAALSVLFVATAWQAGAFDPAVDLKERMTALVSIWPCRVAAAPFVIFNRVIVAESIGPLIVWVSVAAAMTTAVAWAIMRLDAYFVEVSLAASQRLHEMVERARRGGGVPAIGVGPKPRFGLPRFPHLGGAGALAWRQSLELMRGSGRLLFILPACIGPFAAMFISRDRGGQMAQTAAMIVVTVFIGFFVSMIMPLGLRTDLDHVDVIKTLPIRPTAVVWGSTTAAIIYVTLLQWIATIAIAAVSGRWSLATWSILAMAVPINLLFVASDSVLVILFPSVRKFVPGDLLVGVRIMLVNMAKVLFAMVAAGVAALGVLAAWLVWGNSLAAMIAGGSIVLFLEGLATVWVAGLLFARFDPSLEHSHED